MEKGRKIMCCNFVNIQKGKESHIQNLEHQTQRSASLSSSYLQGPGLVSFLQGSWLTRQTPQPTFHNVVWYLQEFLLANFLWMSDTMLVVNWMNRIQNHSIHMRFSFNSVSNLMTKLSDVH